MGIWLYWIFSFLIPLVLQLLFLRLTKSRLRLRFLRWLLPLGILIFLADAWRVSRTPTLFIGLSALAALIDLIAAAAFLLGWGTAWGLFALSTRRKRKKEVSHEKNDPAV